MESGVVKEKQAIPEFLSGGGETGRLIREIDWAKTSLGPVETWPQSLRTCIRIMLSSRQPIWIGWGKDLIKFYNDPYKEIVKGKHPWALGSPASVVWQEIWKDIEAMLKQVMEKGEGTYVESQLLIMERNGYPEETYYTFSYTPIPGDEGGTAGMFCANTDDTDRIITARQLRTLTGLGKNLTSAQSNEEVIQQTMKILKENPYDFPFALFYSATSGNLSLSAATEIGSAEESIPKFISLEDEGEIPQVMKGSITAENIAFVDGLEAKLGAMPKGAWPVSSDKAIILPVMQSGREPFGFLVVGLNPYRLLDEKYGDFFKLVADQMATSFADVLMFEEERKRAHALAELDRAKTTFFSNISHEFRTPLTLLLGPIEEIKEDPSTGEEQRTRAEVAFRNALRMQKLVNTLLEFSRIEAGRVEGQFSPVDICTLTTDLASNFTSAAQKAGISLEINCEQIEEPVYVDVQMWEKIVLNLVSNALKYSDHGTIRINLALKDHSVVFSVADTGVGIPESELENIFNRFHRIENIQGRSQEGTGIGLAMVKELVRLHGGNIQVNSKVGQGSVFTVTFPSGKQHLPSDKIVENSSESINRKQLESYLQEAIRWAPEDQRINYTVSNVDGQPKSLKPLVIVADDNADMREHLVRLLASEFSVASAVDGYEALGMIRELKPQMVISDIMMPKMDGFELLKSLRADPATQLLPVIFLSARAGEEARVEGLGAGADDYLVKPFSGKELQAKVRANIQISRARLAAQKNLESLFSQTPVAIAILRGNPLRYQLANEKALEVWDKRSEDVIGKVWYDVFPELKEQGFEEILDRVVTNGEQVVVNEQELTIVRKGQREKAFFNYSIQPLHDDDGNITGIITTGLDVTQAVLSRKEVEESEAYFRKLADTVPAILWITEKDGRCSYLSKSWYDITGQTENEALGFGWLEMTHPDDFEATREKFQEATQYEIPFTALYRLKQHDGTYRWAVDKGSPRYNSEGDFIGFIGSVTDVHDQQVANIEVQYLATLTDSIADAIIGTDVDDRIIKWNKGAEELYGYKEEEVIWRPAREILPTEFVNRDERLNWRRIFTENGYWRGEVIQPTKDGRRINILASLGLVRNERAEIIGAVAVNRDITERKQIEKAIKESEERYSTTVHASELGLWDFDIANNVLVASGKMAEIYGLKSNDDYTLETVFAAIHPDDLDGQRKFFGEIVNGQAEESFTVEYRIIDATSGATKWIRSQGRAFSHGDGHIYRTVGAVADITREKEAANKVQISESRYKHIFEGTPVSIWEEDFSVARRRVIELVQMGITDFHHYFSTHTSELYELIRSVKINDVNESTLRLVEAENKEQLMRGLGSVFVEDTAAAFIEELQVIAGGGGHFEFETVLQSLKGKRIDVLVHINFPRGEEYNSVLVSLVDISERRRSEAAIRASEAQFRTLAETLPQFVWMTDANGNQLYASSRWRDYSGHEPGPDTWQKIVHPDDYLNMTRAWEESRRLGKYYRAELRLRHRSGQYRWFSAQGEPIKDEAGSVVKWIGSLTDIHDQKEIEQNLEQLISQRTTELQRSNEDLQQFAHVASHDLKEPLRKILTFTSRLEDELSSKLTDKSKTYLDKVKSASHRMSSMIDGVLHYSSLSASEQPIRDVNLEDVIKMVETDLELFISQKKASISTENLPSVQGAAILFYQLFYNLINNSLKFSRPQVPPRISITAIVYEQHGLAEITLEDNGIGFDQEHATRIFESFSRLHPKDQYEGTGLGLALCKKIVLRHGGDIRAEGNLNEGARFVISLPLVQRKEYI
jgi:PAS domain S-box-containing protein